MSSIIKEVPTQGSAERVSIFANADLSSLEQSILGADINGIVEALSGFNLQTKFKVGSAAITAAVGGTKRLHESVKKSGLRQSELFHTVFVKGDRFNTTAFLMLGYIMIEKRLAPKISDLWKAKYGGESIWNMDYSRGCNKKDYEIKKHFSRKFRPSEDDKTKVASFFMLAISSNTKDISQPKIQG